MPARHFSNRVSLDKCPKKRKHLVSLISGDLLYADNFYK